MKVWMVVDKSPYRLPCALFPTLKEACVWIGIPLETAKTAFKRHGFYRGRQYNLERIIL